MTLSITCWGTRGSVPSPGPQTARYGGNTPCLTIERHGGGRLILDAGTGIRALGRDLVSRAKGPLDLTILLSHTHWDHIQGLPFFRPLYHAEHTVRVLGPSRPGASLEAILRGQMVPSVFPVPPAAMGATMTVSEIDPGEHATDGFLVQTVPLRHTGPTLGFRIADATGGPAVSYMTDNELGGSAGTILRADLVRFLRGTDTLVHDAMYFESEVRDRRGWGHSSAAEAVALAREAECRRLVLFHHDPDHDDDALDRLLEEAIRSRGRDGPEIIIAAEGTTLRC